MVEKAPQSTAKQIQAGLQTQGTTVSTRTICRQLNERTVRQTVCGQNEQCQQQQDPTAERERQESPTGVCQNTPELEGHSVQCIPPPRNA